MDPADKKTLTDNQHQLVKDLTLDEAFVLNLESERVITHKMAEELLVGTTNPVSHGASAKCKFSGGAAKSAAVTLSSLSKYVPYTPCLNIRA